MFKNNNNLELININKTSKKSIVMTQKQIPTSHPKTIKSEIDICAFFN